MTVQAIEKSSKQQVPCFLSESQRNRDWEVLPVWRFTGGSANNLIYTSVTPEVFRISLWKQTITVSSWGITCCVAYTLIIFYNIIDKTLYNIPYRENINIGKRIDFWVGIVGNFVTWWLYWILTLTLIVWFWTSCLTLLSLFLIFIKHQLTPNRWLINNSLIIF